MVDGPIGHPGIHVRTPADKGPVSENVPAATQYLNMADITVMDNPPILKLAMMDLVLVRQKYSCLLSYYPFFIIL